MLRSKISVRLLLLGLSVAFVAAYAATHYDLVRDSVRFICISCLGLSD